jgi:hypothetical protein
MNTALWWDEVHAAGISLLEKVDVAVNEWCVVLWVASYVTETSVDISRSTIAGKVTLEEAPQLSPSSWWQLSQASCSCRKPITDIGLA